MGSQRMTLPWKNYIEKIQEDAAECFEKAMIVQLDGTILEKSGFTDDDGTKMVERASAEQRCNFVNILLSSGENFKIQRATDDLSVYNYCRPHHAEVGHANLWMVVCFANTLLLIGVFSGESIKMAQNLQEITNKIKSEGY